MSQKFMAMLSNLDALLRIEGLKKGCAQSVKCGTSKEFEAQPVTNRPLFFISWCFRYLNHTLRLRIPKTLQPLPALADQDDA